MTDAFRTSALDALRFPDVAKNERDDERLTAYSQRIVRG